LSQNLIDQFLKVLESFNSQKVDYVLIGGFAVIIYGLARLTQDIDIVIKMNEENILKLKEALFSVFKDNEIKEIRFDELKNYAVVRYGTPDGFYIDIMARVGEIANYETIDSEIIEYEGVKINIATAKALYELKKNTVLILQNPPTSHTTLIIIYTEHRKSQSKNKP